MREWDTIRWLAREQHRAARGARDLGVTPGAAALLEAADGLTGFTRIGLDRTDSLLDGGEAALDREAGIIWYRRDVPARQAAFYQAHELAHLWLHSAEEAEPTEHPCREGDLDAEASMEPVQTGARKVEGYGPHERREREANVFAREFLLPADALRRLTLEDGLDARSIAARAGLPDGLVRRALADALLLPDLVAAASAVERVLEAALDLDPSQRGAARAERGPLLVEAGPGTGKTRTLVRRVAFLLRERHVPPTSILALTFSNKAAEEMRDRVARVAPEAAPRIWMGTFHAFGLELLRKFGGRIGLPPKPVVLDQVDALLLLERLLPELALDHYANLYDPTLYLKDLLGAISRAKDELKGPEEYRALAQAMRDAAEDDAAVLAAEKALEVARVYAAYQAALGASGLLDFGDLIMQVVRLLRGQPSVRAFLHERYRHILVDEYQDVNRASGLLLRELAGDGAGLWVVGDARQAIYRFRGAAPVNMRLFPRDFPGAAVVDLRRNYRSRPAVVDLFAALAPKMRTAGRAGAERFTPWEPHRAAAAGPQVLMHVAEDDDAEGDGVAREVERQRAAGVPYRDQAVLCRSHTQLARVAARLERASVPMLYLGDVFEREEVRDLLALVSLACERDGRGLVRVAAFPEYAIPLADARTLLALAQEREAAFPEALALAAEAPRVSEQGRAGLALLHRHLDGLCGPETDAWTFLARYLLERGRYLRDLARDESVAGQQQRLAIHQLLQVAQDLPRDGREGEDPKRRLLRHVRRLEIFGEEQALRQVPEWASALDAVRLMTVHASKGLEFGAVYVPALARGAFPASPRWVPCPPPAGLVERADGDDGGPGDDHLEEEECLFFVALSRARDVLCLSRARRYGRQNRGPSDLLPLVAERLPHPPDGPVTWPGDGTLPGVEDGGESHGRGPRPTYTPEMLDLYRDCGRRFYYEYVLGLSGKREDSAYVQFHRCVYDVLRWLREERTAGRAPDEAAAQSRLEEVWALDGPRDHLYEAEYLRAARGMVARAATRANRAWGRLAQPRWEVELGHGRVRVRPDQVEEREDGSVVVRRLRTGRPSEGELKKSLYGLYHAAAEQAYPQRSWSIEVLYLGHDVAEEVQLTQKTVATRLGHYNEAIAGIARGAFPPNPSDRDCPRCPHYFICPAGGRA